MFFMSLLFLSKYNFENLYNIVNFNQYAFLFNIGTITGFLSYDLLSKYVLVGQKGVDYYGEAHLSSWNSWIHTICMPVTIYGILYWFVPLFTIHKTKTKELIWFLYFLYGGHYLRISLIGTLFYYLMYFYVAKYSVKHINNDVLLLTNRSETINNYNIRIRLYLIKKGLIISTTSLFIQEFIGHTFGGDIQSRPEAVLNAIIYATYYSANHFY